LPAHRDVTESDLATINPQRMTAQIDGEVTIFMIGMRINRLLRVDQWWPVAAAMPRMIRELMNAPELGFLGAEQWFGRTTIMVQYWRSFEHLEAYARARDHAHLPAWADFNRRIRASRAVGIWHETYRIRPGEFECIYTNMPTFGLARMTRAVPVGAGRENAAERMRASLQPPRP
jgi:hypothetical protein